jgi:hypothetical protein
MTRTPDEQARQMLRLFPARVRADRGQEAVGLVLDQLPPGTDHLPVAARLDLARAALHAHRRATPPPHVWLDVLVADPRNRRGLVPDAWRPWLVAWLQDPHWKRRYVVRTVVGLLVGLVAIFPLLRTGDGAGIVVNGVMWTGALVVMQAIRASRWRWLVAFRNGLVPADLRPFPGDALKVGLVRPLWPNWSALRMVSIASAVLVMGLSANLGATAVAGVEVLAPDVGDFVFLAALVLAAVAIVLVPALARIRRADLQRPAPPDPSTMVERARTRGAQVGWAFVLAFWIVMAGWRVILQGVAGAVVLGSFLAAAGMLVVALLLARQRAGRSIGIWEVWPGTGPQPFLLVRDDVLRAEGLKGPEARRSSHPGNLA